MSQTLVKIVTIDEAYRAQLIEQLLSLGSTPVTLLVPDECADYEGVERVTETHTGGAAEAAQIQVEGFANVAAFLNSYTGNDNFVLSLKGQLQKYGRLSPKQVACILRMVPQTSTPTAPRVFSLKPGTTLILKKFLAKRIATEMNMTRPHPAVDVLEVKAETEKAWRVRIKLSAQRTAYCGCCGLHLENPESVAAGIGPICAEKWGIGFSGKSLEELKEKLQEKGEIETWIAKSQIRDQVEWAA